MKSVVFSAVSGIALAAAIWSALAEGKAVAAAADWTISQNPAQIVFQAIERKAESSRSATVYGDGRVELWQETPRSPSFRQQVFWLEPELLRDLAETAVAGGLAEWGDDASLERLLRSNLDAAMKASQGEVTRILMVLRKGEASDAYEVIRSFEIPAGREISSDLAEELPEIAWASRWAKLVFAANPAPAGTPPQELPAFEQATFEIAEDSEDPIVELRSSSMSMVSTKLTLRANGRLTFEVTRKPPVVRQLSSEEVSSLLRLLVEGGVAEWHEPTLTARQLRLNSGRPVAPPEDATRYHLTLRFEKYRRGRIVREPLAVDAAVGNLGFFTRYFPEIPEYRAIQAVLDSKEPRRARSPAAAGLQLAWMVDSLHESHVDARRRNRSCPHGTGAS